MTAQTANILAVFPFPFISHQRGLLPISKQLSLRGHNITVITSYPLRDKKLINLTEIDVSNIQEITKTHNLSTIMSSGKNILETIFNFKKMTFSTIDRMFQTESVKSLINSTKRFDLVIGHGIDMTFLAFSWKFKAPSVGN